jgi:hypothetical protein
MGRQIIPIILALACLIPPAHAQAPAYSPRTEPMTFNLAEGSGPEGARRWISATGQIRSETPQAFQRFVKENPVEGLMLVLDSTGGSVQGALRLGRLIRAAKLKTSVGRTVALPTGHALRSRDVGCSSACVLLLMAGVERHVPSDARIGVHMFSVSVDSGGNRVREELTMLDYEQAQRLMAAHAVYLEEMGIAQHYLVLMSAARFRDDVRYLSAKEIAETRLAFIARPAQIADGPTIWIASPEAAAPQLFRQLPLIETADVSAAHELVLTCNSVRGFVTAQYRQSVIRLKVKEGPRALSELHLARIETGGWDFLFRPPRGALIMARTETGEAWMRRDVPRKVFEDAMANRRLDILATKGAGKVEKAAFFDPSLAAAYPDFIRRCDARPGLTVIGPHPRH